MLDINAFCRTCMCQIFSNAEVYLKSYNVTQYVGLAEKLQQCLNISVQTSEGYPAEVCEICFFKICDFYEFQHMCRISMAKFSDMLQELQEEKKINGNGKNDNENDVNSGYDLQNDADTDPLLMEANSSEIMEDVNIERIEMDASESNTTEGKESVLTDNSVEHYNIDVIKNNGNRSENKTIHEEQLKNVSKEEFLSEDSDGSADEQGNGKPEVKKRLQCSLCPKRFILKRCLEAHMRTHQGLLEHPCQRENCGRSFRRFCDLRQHLRDHDGVPRQYRCARNGCNIIFGRFGDLLTHRVDKHGAPKFFVCDAQNCGHKFKSKTYLKTHKEKVHGGGEKKPPEVHMCDTCGDVLRSAASLRMHALIHVRKSEWPYVCDVAGCSKRFRIQQQLKIHQKRHAGIKNYSCPHCDKSYVTSTNLKNHINTHTRERKWTCEYCPKVCYNPDLMRKHCENKHGIITRYPCNMCHRFFKTAHAKKYHEICHIRGDEDDEQPQSAEAKADASKQFPCDFCERVFQSHSKKRYHEMMHTGEKPYECDECGKRFRTSTLLKTHKRSHMKELPRDYVCSVCDRAFFSVQSLRHHELKHTKERPYKCEECGSLFRWPNNLTRHRKLHLRDKKSDNYVHDNENIEFLMEEGEEDVIG